MFAEVIVSLTVDKLDKPFTYKVPEKLLAEGEDLVGQQVIVPFGRGNKEISAFVIELKEEASFDETLIKEILRKDELALSVERKLILLAAFIRTNFGGTMYEALRTVVQLPRAIQRKKKRTFSLLLEEEEAEKKLREFEAKKYTAKARLLKKLIAEKSFVYEEDKKENSFSPSVIKGFRDAGFMEIREEVLYRRAIETVKQEEKSLVLNEAQAEIRDRVLSLRKEGVSKKYLLFGVTGSGKTEVYMDIMEEVIKQGKQVIFLIPEISLTFQMVERLSKRFGERISIMHSRMSDGEKYDQYLMAMEGEIDVIVGPRSALFTPFSRLGLIIVDEEHSESYKSSLTPRYHAGAVAMKRADLEGADLIFGSATPSLSAVSLVNKGELTVLSLTERPKGVTLPKTEIVDLRKELKEGNSSIFSRRLQELIKDRLRKKEQIMLFINRRGFAGFVSCRSCGEVMKCKNCEVSLTFHKPDRLICHYCGYEEKFSRSCPHCTSPYIKTFGLGTEKVEELVKETFKGAKVLRMDADTTKGKHGHEEILSAFRKKEADILVGTQMIVKGHDFKNVTLVGIMAADLSLYSNDFRSAERTYQLLVQAAGRAGRGELSGEVIIQTYQPHHYAVVAAASGNYKEFYEKELRFRKLVSYPPFISLLQIYVTGKEEELVSEKAKAFALSLKSFEEENLTVRLPIWDVIPKVNNVFRMVIIVKAKEKEDLIKIKAFAEKKLMEESFKRVNISFDFPT